MKTILLSFLALSVGLLILVSPVVLADGASTSSTLASICDEAAANNHGTMPAFCDEYAKTKKTKNPVVDIISKVANVLAYLAGAIAVIMVMYGGFLFMTSDGNSDKVSRGRNTILYAAIGLIVIISARLLINFAVMVLIK